MRSKSGLKSKKLWIFLGIILLILFLNRQFGWSDYFGNSKNLDFFQELVQEHLWQAALLYIALTIVSCVVLALPGVSFALFAGMIFGPWLGIFFCLLATTIGASVAFLVGRFFLKETIKPLAEKNQYLKKLLFEESGKSDLLVLMITRLVPVFPYNLQNFLYGISDIGFWPYTLYTFIFMFPGVSFITIGAAGLAAEAHQGLYFFVAALIFLAVLAIGYFLQKRYLADTQKGS